MLALTHLVSRAATTIHRARALKGDPALCVESEDMDVGDPYESGLGEHRVDQVVWAQPCRTPSPRACPHQVEEDGTRYISRNSNQTKSLPIGHLTQHTSSNPGGCQPARLGRAS